jgi:hypothetical protein
MTCARYADRRPLEHTVRPTLSRGVRAGKSEEVVAPGEARRTPTIGRPGRSIFAGTDPTAETVIGAVVGRGRHALL